MLFDWNLMGTLLCKIMHANFGQQYVHVNAECVEFLLSVLDTYNVALTGTLLHIACQYTKGA